MKSITLCNIFLFLFINISSAEETGTSQSSANFAYFVPESLEGDNLTPKQQKQSECMFEFAAEL